MQYCLYLRKSRSDIEAEAHGEGETLARHEKLLLELAKRDQYNVTQIYREIVSGETIAARPVVQQLLQDVADGKWTGVLVVEIERLARGNTMDQGYIAQTFMYSKTKIITPLKVYDPANNEFDEEYFEFGLFMARREYKTINRRLVGGRHASAKDGKWVNSSAPYGYERVRIQGDKGWTLRPVEEEADIIRFLFRLYTSGEEDENGIIRQIGTHTLALRLDKMGVAPPRSAYWHDRTIQAMLKNPVYIGKIRYNVNKTKKRIINNKVEVEHYKAPAEDVILVDGLHPPIVDEDVFLKAQELMERSGPPPVPKNKVVRNPLAGILVCGKCGRNIILRPNARNNLLMCQNRKCDCISSKFDIVEERLLQTLSVWLSDYRLEWSDKPPAEEQSIIDFKQKALRKAYAELETLHKQIGRTHDLLEQGVYDTDTFLARSKSLTERINNTEADIAFLAAELAEDEKRAASRRNIIPKVEKLIDVYYELPSAQAKNEMLKEVLEKVEYTKLQRSGKNGPFDNFELVLYPKLPHSLEE